MRAISNAKDSTLTPRRGHEFLQELKSACSTAQMKRLLSQSPFELVYAPALGKEGQDGYWMLNSGPTGGALLEKEPGVFVRP